MPQQGAATAASAAETAVTAALDSSRPRVRAAAAERRVRPRAGESSWDGLSVGCVHTTRNTPAG